ncbi:MAG TPA: PadR family transcriptional regulator [Caulobacteraceae bacterium]|jgi:DNA-binding PadR family transcriptional regulator|nr:PadR family transcriptional regulator [Caulobacteraceae bacterium]
MFGRHNHWGRHSGFHGRGPFGFHAHQHAHHRGGGRSGRFFDHGDLRFVILKLIADQPSHGYELIKAVEQTAGGAYSPSPGVIYPTLTLLEELGYVTATDEAGGKKLYTITPEGQAFLKANDSHVGGLFARMAEVAAQSAAFAPQVLRARENLKTALRIKLTSAQLTPEQITALAQVLDDAARTIEQL